MINIITKKYSEEEYDYIFNNFDEFVNAFVSINDFTDLDEYALEIIDNAFIRDRHTDLIDTKYGTTTIDNVSSGCKTVLTYLYYKRNISNYEGSAIFDVNECGWNALDVLFDLVDKLEDSETRFYLCHQNEIYRCKERRYVINGKKEITDLLYI